MKIDIHTWRVMKLSPRVCKLPSPVVIHLIHNFFRYQDEFEWKILFGNSLTFLSSFVGWYLWEGKRKFLLIWIIWDICTFALSAVEDSLQIASKLRRNTKINFGCSSTSDVVKQNAENPKKKNSLLNWAQFCKFWQWNDKQFNFFSRKTIFFSLLCSSKINF